MIKIIRLKSCYFGLMDVTLQIKFLSFLLSIHSIKHSILSGTYSVWTLRTTVDGLNLPFTDIFRRTPHFPVKFQTDNIDSMLNPILKLFLFSLVSIDNSTGVT